MATGPSSAESDETRILRAEQEALAQRVIAKDAFPKVLRTIAGFVVRAEPDGATIRAAGVLLDADSLQTLETQLVRVPARLPELPGLQTFRAVPALLELLSRFSQTPDLAFVDGHGIAHPQRLGIASHFGVAADLPAIGVAKDILIGESATALHEMRGAFTTLRENGAHIGWLLRSKADDLPLVVSPGHRVAMATAPEMTMRFVAGERLPEPTRLAERVFLGG